MSQRIYMDNSATSFPKPPEVAEAMGAFMRDCGASAGRGAYSEAKACERMILSCRARVAGLINAPDARSIVFGMNCSEGLSIAIRGLLNTAARGTHAIATAMEHNSVLRPLNALAAQVGIVPEFIACDGVTGLVDPDDIRKAIRPETKLIACVHVSNVTGTLQPIKEVCAIAQEAGIPSLIDSAQAAGHVEIDVQTLGADFVAFPGHKGLLGPLGTGVLYVRPGAQEHLPTMKEGGTGTISEQAVQPSTMPDKYEIGSHNAVGLAGLEASCAWVGHRTVAALRAHDVRVSAKFMELTADTGGLTVYGPRDTKHRCGVFSVSVSGLSAAQLAAGLERDYGILTRPGVHCAPLAHKTIGTHPAGTCRLSFGAFTTEHHIETAAAALAEIAART